MKSVFCLRLGVSLTIFLLNFTTRLSKIRPKPFSKFLLSTAKHVLMRVLMTNDAMILCERQRKLHCHRLEPPQPP